MGNIDDAVPFFGKGFNKIYPLIMVIYTLLVASNFFNRVIDYLGNWNIFRLQTEADDTDGFDPSGLLILQKGKLCMCFAEASVVLYGEDKILKSNLHISVSKKKTYF